MSELVAATVNTRFQRSWFTRFHLLATFQALDVITTAYVLLHLGGVEGNPVARMLTNLGALGLILVLALKLWIVVRLEQVNASPRRILAANIIYGTVLFNNLLVLTGNPSPILAVWRFLS